MSQINLRKLQLGNESAWGTAVPATARLMGVQDGLRIQAQQEVIPVRYSGNLSPAQNSAQVRAWATGNLPIVATYDDLLYLLHGVFGSVSPAGTASPYTWTYSAPLETAVTPYLYSMEYGEGSNKYVLEGGLMSNLRISGNATGLWEAQVDLLGECIATLGSFASLSDRAVVLIRGADTKVYSDTWSGTMGSTELAATLIDFELALSESRHLKWFGGSDLPLNYGDGDWSGTLRYTAEFNTNAKAILDAMIAPAKVQRQIEIKADAGDSVNTAQIQFCGTLTNALELWSDRDGNMIVELIWAGEYNTTFANWLKIIMANAVATLT